MVAPPAGAWIETDEVWNGAGELKVAPPAGAWIETNTNTSLVTLFAGRAPRGRVD